MLWKYELYFEPNVRNPVVAMYALLYRSAATEIFIFLARISAGPVIPRLNMTRFVKRKTQK
jgi:hypothetical protein